MCDDWDQCVIFQKDVHMTVSTGYEFRPRLELIIKLLLVVFSLHISRLSFRIKKHSIYRCSDCVAVARVDCSIQKTPEPKKVRLAFYIIASYTFSVHLSTFLLFLFQNGYATPFQTSSTTSQIHISEEPWCPHDWYSCMNVSCTFVLTNRGPHIYWLEDFCWKSSLKIKIVIN